MAKSQREYEVKVDFKARSELPPSRAISWRRFFDLLLLSTGSAELGDGQSDDSAQAGGTGASGEQVKPETGPSPERGN